MFGSTSQPNFIDQGVKGQLPFTIKDGQHPKAGHTKAAFPCPPDRLPGVHGVPEGRQGGEGGGEGGNSALQVKRVSGVLKKKSGQK